MMKHKQRISLLIAVIMCISVFSPGAAKVVNAAETTKSGILFEETYGDYYLEEDGEDYCIEGVSKDFTLEHKGKVTVYIEELIECECEDEENCECDESEGSIDYIYFLNDKGKRIDAEYVEDEGYCATLEAGDYTLCITSVEWVIDVVFYASYEYAIDPDDPFFMFDKKSAAIGIGETVQLKIESYPAGSSITNVKWASDDPSVATVNSNGVITGVSEGNAIISATIGDTVLKCDVSVIKPEYSSLNYKSASLYAGETLKLDIKVFPESYGLEGLKWVSSNPKVADVSADGTVTAKAAGNATITASINGEERDCAITVLPIGISAKALTVYIKKSATLTINGGTGTTKWVSSNPKVATVSAKGVVTGKGVGKAIITGQKNGKKYSCTVTVKYPPENGSVWKKNIVVPYGETEFDEIAFTLKGVTTFSYTLKSTADKRTSWAVFPAELDITNVNDPDDQYTVYSDYVELEEESTKTITLKPGKYVLEYGIRYGGELNFTMHTKPQLSATSMVLAKGISKTLKPVAIANGGKWSTSNKKIATVSSKGVVKGKKNGTCYIKYTMKTGQVLKCKVVVKKNKVSFKVSKNPYNYSYGVPHVVMKSAYYDGKKMKVDLYVINNRMFKASKFKYITLKIYDGNDKLIASKKFKNVKLNIPRYKSKKITLTFTKKYIKQKNVVLDKNIYEDYKYYYIYKY